MAESSRRWRTAPGKRDEAQGERPRPRGTVAGRLAALERRVEALERQAASSKPVQPAAETKPLEAKPSPRFPGCHLQVSSIARGRCPWCGFVFDALAELRRAARRRG